MVLRSLKQWGLVLQGTNNIELSRAASNSSYKPAHVLSKDCKM